MQIRRIRRLSQKDADEICDFCDQAMTTGFSFSGENVSGPRSGVFLIVCDQCLQKTIKSKIGFLNERIL